MNRNHLANPISTTQESNTQGFPPSDRFQCVRRIGKGGQSHVFEALDKQHDNLRVALKVLRNSRRDVHALKREFAVLSELRHKNLVNLYDLVCEGGVWFITMELIDGVELRNWRYRDFNELRAVFCRLAEALHAIHLSGRLHRDVKPDNVMIRGDGSPVLLDFGLVANWNLPGTEEYIESIAETGLTGTIEYIAPEIYASSSPTPESDFYSLGTTLFSTVTGSVPFPYNPNGGLFEYGSQKVSSSPPDIRDRSKKLPEDIALVCNSLLRVEPSQRPGGLEIIRRLGGSSDPQLTEFNSSTSNSSFVGRETHLESLSRAFGAIETEGHCVVAHIKGVSGVGKSTLVKRFLDELRDQQPVVLSGRCFETASVPFKAVDSVVDSLRRYLRKLDDQLTEVLLPRNIDSLLRVFPVLEQVNCIRESARKRPNAIQDQQEVRRRAFLALRELLGRICEHERLVVFIDDLQWGDTESAKLLADLVRPPDPPAMMLLLAFREEEIQRSNCLIELEKAFKFDGKGVEVLDLPVDRLPESDARRLALSRLAAQHASTSVELAKKIVQEAEGIPYFVHELARFGADTIPDLKNVVHSRIEGLDPSARRLLEFAAVAGRPLSQRELLTAAGLEEDYGAALQYLDSLKVNHLLKGRGRSSEDLIETFHDRIRESVVKQLDDDQLKRRYASLAFAGETIGTVDPETLAEYYDRAGMPDKARKFCVSAGDQAAASLAFDRAVRLYKTTIGLWGDDQELPSDLFVKLGDALTNAGRFAEAADAYMDAAADANAADRLDLRGRAAIQNLYAGQYDEGFDSLSKVLSSVGLPFPQTPFLSVLRLSFCVLQLALRKKTFQQRDESQISAEQLGRIDICWSAAIGLSGIDTVRGAYFLHRNLLLALSAGEPYRISRSMGYVAMHMASTGQHRKAELQLERAMVLRTGLKSGNDHLDAVLKMVAGMLDFFKGRYESAVEKLDQSVSIFRERCAGGTWEHGNAQSFSLVALHELGRYGDLRNRLPAILAEAEERNDLFLKTTLQSGMGVEVRLDEGDPSEAERYVAHAHATWSQDRFHLTHHFALYGAAHLSLYRERAEEAFFNIQEKWAAFRKSQLQRVCSVRVMMLSVRARAALAAYEGRTNSMVLQSAKRDARALMRLRAPKALGFGMLAEAGIASLEGNLTRALELSLACEQEFSRHGLRAYAAVAKLRRGQLSQDAHVAKVANDEFRNLGVLSSEVFARIWAPGYRIT
ncbi:MAG: AAA family ATPase [Planctomycetota bacterium]